MKLKLGVKLEWIKVLLHIDVNMCEFYPSDQSNTT